MTCLCLRRQDVQARQLGQDLAASQARASELETQLGAAVMRLERELEMQREEHRTEVGGWRACTGYSVFVYLIGCLAMNRPGTATTSANETVVYVGCVGGSTVRAEGVGSFSGWVRVRRSI